jgi:hypothetical protein
VQGARAYRIELRKAVDDALIARFTQSESRVENRLPDLVAGDYHLLVRAIDADDIPGAISAPLVLKVVGVAVPEGAKLQPDARIEMQRSQTVQLTNADGLSLKRATERKVRPANEPVGIANGQATPLMIHDHDTTNACLVWLLPSQSPIVAYVGPKWAVWPHEAINLRVQWADRSGHRLPSDVEPKVSVYVGIRPVEVVWDKQPDVWHAKLDAQPGPGPWVIRLEVRDQTGELLARDFLEVVERPRRQFVAESDAFRQPIR